MESGKLRALAIVDSKPAMALPGIKTLEQETGLKPIYFGTWRGLAVPKDTPDAVVSILTAAFMKGAAEPEFAEYMNKNGLGLSIKDSKDFGKFIEDNDKSFGEIIPSLGLGKK